MGQMKNATKRGMNWTMATAQNLKDVAQRGKMWTTEMAVPKIKRVSKLSWAFTRQTALPALMRAKRRWMRWAMEQIDSFVAAPSGKNATEAIIATRHTLQMSRSYKVQDVAQSFHDVVTSATVFVIAHCAGSAIIFATFRARQSRSTVMEE